jgi:hypothetical protein
MRADRLLRVVLWPALICASLGLAIQGPRIIAQLSRADDREAMIFEKIAQSAHDRMVAAQLERVRASIAVVNGDRWRKN